MNALCARRWGRRSVRGRRVGHSRSTTSAWGATAPNSSRSGCVGRSSLQRVWLIAISPSAKGCGLSNANIVWVQPQVC